MKYDRTQIRPGMTVSSTEGEKLGKIAQVGDEEFIIEKGWLFKEDYRARCDRITDIRGDEVIYQRLGAEAEAAPAAETGAPIAEAGAPMAEAAPTTEAAPPASAAGEEMRVPLAEEQLVVDKEAREREAARLRKEVVTEEQQVTVPVRHEEIVVERAPAAESRAPGGEAFKEQEIGVTAMEEEVHVSKQPVVREEVRVRKEPVIEQRAATGEVRREEAHIEEAEPGRVERREEEGGMRAPGRDEDKKI